jgi:hypothetical protein
MKHEPILIELHDARFFQQLFVQRITVVAKP